jgi:hypothetical protein
MSKLRKTTTNARVAARVQSAVAGRNNGQVPKGSYASRLQSAADRSSQHAATTKSN